MQLLVPHLVHLKFEFKSSTLNSKSVVLKSLYFHLKVSIKDSSLLLQFKFENEMSSEAYKIVVNLF